MASLRAPQPAPRTLLLFLATVCGSLAFPTQHGGGSSGGTRVRRVAGGSEVSATSVPYQVRIDHPAALCGGTIIHPSYVLTAKHCIKGRNPKQTRVFVGSPSNSSGDGRPEEMRLVRRFVLFPDKDQPEKRGHWLPKDVDPLAVMGDIGLVQVEPPFPLDKTDEVRPVPLRKGRGYEGRSCVLSGWGTTSINDTSSSKLRAASVEVFPRKKCSALEKRLKDDYICAGHNDGGVDACSGDSGGPLVCDGLLTGVVKGGRGCGESQQVTKYTEVALYARWVAHVVGLSEERLGYAWQDAWAT